MKLISLKELGKFLLTHEDFILDCCAMIIALTMALLVVSIVVSGMAYIVYKWLVFFAGIL